MSRGASVNEKPIAVKTAETTLIRVLETVYLRFLCEQTGQRPDRLTHAERITLLDTKILAFKTDFERLRECVRYAYSAGAESVHTRLHAAEGVDHEMLEEALAAVEVTRG